MNKTRAAALLLAAACLFSACASDLSATAPTVDDGKQVVLSKQDEEMFTDRDRDPSYETAKSTAIAFKGDQVSCSSAAVTVDGSTVTVSREGTYILSGTLNNGTILVNADDKAKVQLVLKNASVTSAGSAPLCVLGADKVFVTLAEGTENVLANGGSFAPLQGEAIDAAVYSKQDLTFNGTGSLRVESPAGNGIVSKDDLVFVGGSYTVTASEHALCANDSVRITQADMQLTAGKDGVHSENTKDDTLGFVYYSGGELDIQAEGDGVSASAYLQYNDGALKVLAGGGYKNGEDHTSKDFMEMPGRKTETGSKFDSTTEETDSVSQKGLKAADIRIAAGDVEIDAADDGIHANGTLTIDGGTLTVAGGDDALHADETLTVNAGKLDITHSYEGMEAKNITVAGGDITVKAKDDGLNASDSSDSDTGGMGNGGGPNLHGRPGPMDGAGDGSITISGGDLMIQASGDGIDANGTLTVSGGKTVVMGPISGDTAVLDFDVSGIVSGGTFIGTGSLMMAQSFTESSQGVIALSLGNQSGGTQITVADRDGNVLLSHTPTQSYQILIFTDPQLVKGESYTLTVGENSKMIEAE